MPTPNEDFLAACKICNLNQIKKSLEEGANINIRDINGNNGLHLTGKIDSSKLNDGQIELVKTTITFLLQKGINYKAKNSFGQIPQVDSGLRFFYSSLIEDFEYEKTHLNLELQKEQTALLKSVSQKLDSQTTSITEVIKQLQQPLDFEKQKTLFLENENQLLQKQLALQVELENLRKENYNLKQELSENVVTANQKNSLSIFK